MGRNSWAWYATLGLFYLALAWAGYSFHRQATELRRLQVDTELDGRFEGNDWVTWQNTNQGVVAQQVHPLPGYKPIDQRRIREGDRLLQLDFIDITQAEVVDRITRAARPGHIFVAKFERTDPYSQTVEVIEAMIKNGFRLGFSYNQTPFYWHLSSWIAGLGAFMALIMLAILLPLARTDRRKYLPLLGVVISALLWFFLQMLRHVYLIVESDLERTGVEKAFLLGYIFLLFSYAIFYFLFKSGARHVILGLPSLVLGSFLGYRVYEIVYLTQELKHFHDLIEAYAFIFFLLHLVAALCLFMVDRWPERNLGSYLGLMLITLVGGAGIAYYALPGLHGLLGQERALFVFQVMAFFPLINATLLQLQFGKVSLVVTQTIQYLVAFLVSIVLYLLITQLFEYIRPTIQYRQILEFISFLILIVILRLIYLANENRLSKYFVSDQRERLNKFKTFIASIPRYTSAEQLCTDLEAQLRDFFRADPVELVWQESPPPEMVAAEGPWDSQVYPHLVQTNAVWSRTKEISPLRFDADLEKKLLRTPYTLLSPVTVDEDQFGLLRLGRKKRGVYNLSDLELISNLIQQTQLTLNVLQLVKREKELIQQTYEANLTALRSQINPHFLFNTLNSIGELVHESAERAEQAIEKLAFIFRYTLKKSSENFVPLSEEINLITTYLELEKIRFAERLDVHIEVEPGTKDVPIPAFILQTLVENCIKHGIAKILHKGLVSVEAFREDAFLVCEVVDNGPGIDLSRIHQSTGLSNSIARLENIYDLKNLLYFENTGEGTYVRLKIPLGPQA